MPVPPIDIEEVIERMHRVCGDTEYTKHECAEAYEEMAATATIGAVALREEIAAEEEEAGVFDDERDTTIAGRDCT